MQGSLFRTVSGIFYRGVDPHYREYALSGSRVAGRYSRADQPTLYLSASSAGVEAAMIAHAGGRSGQAALLKMEVTCPNVFDLRDAAACERAEISLKDAVSPWQEIVAAGGCPSSWLVREKIEKLGGIGLIDPSRKAPGLWHLVIFRWNAPGGAHVEIVDPAFPSA